MVVVLFACNQPIIGLDRCETTFAITSTMLAHAIAMYALHKGCWSISDGMAVVADWKSISLDVAWASQTMKAITAVAAMRAGMAALSG